MHLVKNSTNRYYRNALLKEITIDNNSKNPQWPPDMDLHPKILCYHNEILFKSDKADEFSWYKIFSQKTYENCLTLGTQNGRHERYLLENKIVKRWDSIVLAKPLSTNLSFNNETLNYTISDLNFSKLPENKYDLIFCHGLLHHIINLEHLLFEINKSLRRDGIFVCSEYIGENKWQWSDYKLELLNTLISEKYSNLINLTKFCRPAITLMNARPLESIRSQEIPELLKYHFDIEFISMFDYILYPGINYTNFQGKFKEFIIHDNQRLDDYLDFLIENDYKIFKSNIKSIIPNALIGIFRKKYNLREKIVVPWTKNEIKTQLFIKHDTLGFKIRRKINKTINRF